MFSAVVLGTFTKPPRSTFGDIKVHSIRLLPSEMGISDFCKENYNISGPQYYSLVPHNYNFFTQEMILRVQ